MKKKKPPKFAAVLDDLLGLVGLAIVFCGLYTVDRGWAIAAMGTLVVWIAVRLQDGPESRVQSPEPEEDD